MKDQYVADIGDYGKYSLLKAFINAGVSVGINWYLTQDDGTNDGKYTSYLDSDSKSSLRPYDPETFDALKLIRDSEKTILGVEKSGLLSGACFYGKRMVFEGNAEERWNQRMQWHQNAMEQLKETSLVFLDPDNGLRINESHDKKADKYVFADEIRAYYEKHNVVYYCHKGRRSAEEWEKYKSIMPTLLPNARPIVLTYHKGTQRSFIFLIHPEDYDRYRSIINSFLKNWKGIFTEESVMDPEQTRYIELAAEFPNDKNKITSLIPEQVIPESVLKQPSELKKKRVLKWVVVSVLIAIGLALIIVILSTNVSRKREATYNQAVEMAMQGNWKDSIDTFESLFRINYRGARDFYLYCKGKKEYEEGDLKAAYHTVGQTMLKDLTEDQRKFIQDYFFELDHEYHRRYGYDLPSNYKPSSSNSSSSSSGSGNNSHSSGSNSSTKTDPYNAKDYANEDDFWEDYYNDFIDFDEAEQYWDAHH